ncbi:O-succinylbenzoic acid--CoA ligase, partial [Flavobacteriaceae bacterium]|nr:O-succinylbenzoic acid--CoA ligase [Flavobacteriaceae bacterium]
MDPSLFNSAFMLNGVSFSVETLLLSSKTDNPDFFQFLKQWTGKSSTIELYTSGSTGLPKKIHISKSKMVISAKRTAS